MSLWVAEQDTPGGPTEWRLVVDRKTARLATQRNRWKRRIREVLRSQKNSFRPGHLIRIKAHPGKTATKYSELEREILELVKKAGVCVE